MFLESDVFIYLIFSLLALFSSITFIVSLISFYKSLRKREQDLIQFYEQKQKKIWGLVLLCQEAGVGNTNLPSTKVLELMVEKVAEFTEAEKVVLAFSEEEGEEQQRKFSLNSAKVIVRGSHHQSPESELESWWAREIEKIAEIVLEKKTPVIIPNSKLRVREGSGSKNSKNSEKRVRPNFMLCVPLTIEDENFGILSAINSRPYSLEDDEALILSLFGKFATLIIKNARLIKEEQASLIAAERDRLAKEMHDGLAQSLFGMMQELQVCRKLLPKNPQFVEKKLKKLQLTLSEAMKDLRRHIYELKPIDFGWQKKGLRFSIAQFIKEFSERSAIPVDFVIEGKESSSFFVQEDLYRIAREALVNVAKHAEARNVTVRLVFKEEKISLSIEDDGKGFDSHQILEEVKTEGIEAEGRIKMGLRNMIERAEALGGICCIDSRPDRGTKIAVVVPKIGERSSYVKDRLKDQIAYRR